MNILLSDFPPPEFLDKGELGIDENIYHQRVKVEGEIISINDSVLILSNQDDFFTFCGRILLMWEDKKLKKLAKINWYWKRSELNEDTIQYVLHREILLSEHTDIIPIDSIKSKITVYLSPDLLGKDVNLSIDNLTSSFFCNRGYISSKLEFVAYSTIIRLMKLSQNIIECVDGNSKYDIGRTKLQLNNVQSVAGRNNEFNQINITLKRFLIQNGKGNCLYISGVPGTGKTLCVRQVMKILAQEQLNGKIPLFEYYEINCLRFETSKDLFSELWYVLSGEKLNNISSLKMLNETFTYDPPPNYIVVLIDEVDVLLTNNQNELYSLLEWASLPKSNFIIVCIANLMDLETRLKPKIASRFGNNSIKFFAYKFEELIEIINSRIGDLDIFEPKAIELCCRKISTIGGDARKCLEACKRSIDLIQNNEKHDKVKVEDMQNTLKELHSIRAIDLFEKLSENQQLFLISFITDSRLTSRNIIPIRDIIKRIQIFKSQLKISNSFSLIFLITIANQLLEMKIIKTLNQGLINTNSLISLLSIEQDIIICLKKNNKFSRFLTFS